MHEPSQASAHERVRRPFIYLPSFAGGGAERVFTRLANHLAASGMEPHFVVNIDEGPVRASLSPSVRVHELGAAKMFAVVPRLAKLLRRERPDILLSALVGPNIVAVAARALARTKTPVIISERNHLSSLLAHRSVGRRVALLALARMAYPRADAIVAVAEGVADDLADVVGLARREIDVIHNPSPEPEGIAAARQALPPHPWLGPGQPTLVAMGRLVAQKDYATLLRALAIVRDTRADVRLLILGDGPLLADLTQQAAQLGVADVVQFVGFVENRFEFVANAALYVLSSKTEGFPNSLIEALACGVPVVSTDCAGGGAAAILASDYPEALTPVGNAERLAQAILLALGRPAPVHSIDAIASRFTIQKVADAYRSLFASTQQRVRNS